MHADQTYWVKKPTTFATDYPKKSPKTHITKLASDIVGPDLILLHVGSGGVNSACFVVRTVAQLM